MSLVREISRKSLPVVACAVFLGEMMSMGRTEDLWKLRRVPEWSPDRTMEIVTYRFSPDGNLAAAAYTDRSIRLWDLRTGREIRRFVGHEGKPTYLSFSPDGKRLVSSQNYGFRLWSVDSGEDLFRLVGNPDCFLLSPVAFHPNGTHFLGLVLESGRYIFSRWDAKGFEQTVSSPGPMTDPRYIGVSCDGRYVITVSEGSGTYLWDDRVNKWKDLREQGFPRYVVAAAFSPDARYIAVAEQYIHSGAVILYDTGTLHEVRRFWPPGYVPESNLIWYPRNVQFTRDGRCVYATTGYRGDTGYEWEIATGKGREVSGSGLLVKADGREALAHDGYGNLALFDFSTGRYIARYAAYRNEDKWVVETAAGYLDFGGDDRPELDSYELRKEADSYFQQYHQPKIVARILSGMSVADAETLPDDHRSPEVALELVGVKAERAELQVSAKVFGAGNAVKGLGVTVNGRALQSIRTKDIERERPDKNEFEWRAEVDFPPGENTATVRAIASDKFGQQSKPASLVIERPVKVSPVPGRLFVLAVGVSTYRRPDYKLQFCHADAEALADALLGQKGRAFGDVQVQVYTDKQATVTNVEDGLAWLQRSCTPADVAVVLFSGHGIRGERGLYYMTHEANVNGIQYTCLNWETVAKAMKGTQAKQILFLSDVCYAGSFAETQLASQQELAASLRQTAGIMVFTSSRGDEKSLEDRDWKHGAFCKALLEAIDGEADRNGDKKVTVGEIHDYVSPRVVELTKDRQHPELPDLGDFDPELILSHVLTETSAEDSGHGR